MAKRPAPSSSIPQLPLEKRPTPAPGAGGAGAGAGAGGASSGQLVLVEAGKHLSSMGREKQFEHLRSLAKKAQVVYHQFWTVYLRSEHNDHTDVIAIEFAKLVDTLILINKGDASGMNAFEKKLDDDLQLRVDAHVRAIADTRDAKEAAKRTMSTQLDKFMRKLAIESEIVLATCEAINPATADPCERVIRASAASVYAYASLLEKELPRMFAEAIKTKDTKRRGVLLAHSHDAYKGVLRAARLFAEIDDTDPIEGLSMSYLYETAGALETLWDIVPRVRAGAK